MTEKTEFRIFKVSNLYAAQYHFMRIIWTSIGKRYSVPNTVKFSTRIK